MLPVPVDRQIRVVEEVLDIWYAKQSRGNYADADLRYDIERLEAVLATLKRTTYNGVRKGGEKP